MEHETKKAEVLNEELRREILAMVEADQVMRKKAYEGLILWDEEMDKRHTVRMREIIRQYGWPGKSLIGEEGAHGVWLLIQHADHEVDFQAEALRLLHEAVLRGEAEKEDEAYLTDRVRTNLHQPQVFGTQFHVDVDGVFRPRPIEDLEHLEERRSEFGLGSFIEYEEQMQVHHGVGQKDPAA